jgi:hypothetical protein
VIGLAHQSKYMFNLGLSNVSGNRAVIDVRASILSTRSRDQESVPPGFRILLSIIYETNNSMKNGVFWVVTPCGSCKNRRFGGTWRLLHQGDKNR